MTRSRQFCVIVFCLLPASLQIPEVRQVLSPGEKVERDLSFGEIQKALDHYAQALNISDEINFQRGRAYSLANLGMLYRDLGDTKRALI